MVAERSQDRIRQMPSHPRALFVLPSFDRSGAVDFIVDPSGAMTSEGSRVEILVLDGSSRASRMPDDSVVVTTALHKESSRFRKILPVRQIRTALRWLQQRFRLLKSIWRSDVVILTWEMGPALLPPSVAAFVLRKPTVAVVQNNISFSLQEYQGRARRDILRWCYARARVVICVSHDLMAVVERLGVSKDKLVAIPNAVNIERVRRLAKQPPPEIVTADERPMIVGIGRLSSQKGFDLLIEAHAKVLERGTEHRLVLTGHGPDKNDLKTLAQELAVEDSVQFLGYMSNPYPVIAHASVLCLSSRYEGRGLVLCEAAVLGVPMIAADCPAGPREVLADGRYGDLVEPGSAEALADAIEAHLRNPGRLIAKARTAASDADHFSIGTCAKQYIELIHQHID